MNPRLAVQPTLGSPEPEHAARVFLSDLADGDRVASSVAVRERSRLTRRNGDDFVKLVVGDRTATIEAVAWDAVDECFQCSDPGAVVFVEGRFTVHERYGPKITIEAIRIAEPGEYAEADLVESSPVPVDLLETDLRDLIATIRDPHLAALLDRFFGAGTQNWERFRVAPAAKFYHQAYTHGLLEHALSVAQAVSAAAAAFPGIDRDLAVTGALLHDIGKTQAYNDDPLAIDLTDAGRLPGEIPIGYYLVRRQIESIEGFDPELGQAVLHIILSHHGTHEMGSPVVPATREATLVHMMDNLGGRLGSFDRIERELAEGQSWSKFDRGLDSAAYFPARRAA
ncbi:MAG: HD domain-containing protein [Actinomycetota bacterium]|nr:HD domain-containing protein [Actinomycetota bacterium]